MAGKSCPRSVSKALVEVLSVPLPGSGTVIRPTVCEALESTVIAP